MKRLPEEALLRQLSQLARDEEREAADLELDRPSIDEIMVAVTRSQPVRPTRAMQLLRQLRVWLAVPCVLAIGTAAFMLVRMPHATIELPVYELSLISAGGTRSAATGELTQVAGHTSGPSKPGPAIRLRAGTRAILGLRPASQSAMRPAISVWFGPAKSWTAWPARVETDAGGAARVELTAPPESGDLMLLVCGTANAAASVERALAADSGCQHWFAAVDS